MTAAYIATNTGNRLPQQQQRQRHHLLRQIECNEIRCLKITKEVEDVFVVDGCWDCACESRGNNDDDRMMSDDDYEEEWISSGSRSSSSEEFGMNHKNIRALLEALARNRSISSIMFEGDFLDCLRDDQRSELLQTIGNRDAMPLLTDVTIGDSPVRVSDLTYVLRSKGSIVGLHIHDLLLRGTVEDFRSFRVAVLCNASLKDFEVNECVTVVVSGPPSPTRGFRNSTNGDNSYDEEMASSVDVRAIYNEWRDRRNKQQHGGSNNNMSIENERVSIVPRTA